MPTSRYISDYTTGQVRRLSTAAATVTIRKAISNGTLGYSTQITTGADRLDNIAGKNYGDGRYWWVLAAASDIGWGMQVPPGTIIRVPNIGEVLGIIA